MSEQRNPPENDDFEWVNTWANGTSPAKGDTPKQASAPNAASAADLAEQPAAQEAIAPHPTEIVAPKPALMAQPNIADVIAPAPRKRGPDADQFVHPATRRFFAALRAPVSAPRSEASTAPIAPADAQSHQPIRAAASPSPVATSFEALPAPASAAAGPSETATAVTPAATATNEPAMVESAEASLAPDASQLERDIAEIECARDALVDPAPFTIADPRKPRSRFSMLRHAESVPILVGSVVGATLLIVFGAAASLISLR